MISPVIKVDDGEFVTGRSRRGTLSAGACVPGSADGTAAELYAADQNMKRVRRSHPDEGRNFRSLKASRCLFF